MFQEVGWWILYYFCEF